MNLKAQAIRARQQDTNPILDAPRDDTYDAEKNAKIFQEAQDISLRKGLQTYLISCQGEPVCTIIFKITESRVTAIVTKLVNHRRVMWKSWAGGYGYDKMTAAMEGLELSYKDDNGATQIKIEDKYQPWYRQFEVKGFKVWRTL